MRNKKVHKNIFISLLWLLMIVFSVLISFLLVKFFQKSVFRRLSRVNFVLIGADRNPLVFSFEEKGGFILKLDPREKIVLSYGFGEYEIGKVFALGELEKKGGLLLGSSLENYLSAPIFGFFSDDKIDLENFNNKPKMFFSRIFLRAIFKNNKTNLGITDLFFLFLRSMALDSFKLKTIGDQQNLKELFKDSQLRKEAYPIEVFNATDHFGLAQKTGSFLERSGALVIRIMDSDKKENLCQVSSDVNLKESYTWFWLQKVFADCSFKIVNENSGRARFSLVIGENEWKKLNEKW